MEARGISQDAAKSPNQSSSTTTASLLEDNTASTQLEQLSKVDRLQKELKAAELEEPIWRASVTTHGLSNGMPVNGCDNT